MHRISLVAVLGIILIALTCLGASAESTVNVAFFQQENIYFAQRVITVQPDPAAAVAELMRGPADYEAAMGVTTYIPASWTVESAYVYADYLVVNLGGIPADTYYPDDVIDGVLTQFDWTLRQFGLMPKLMVGSETISVLRYPQPDVGRRPEPIRPTEVLTGNLAGKVICLSAGHGYAWNGSSWGTQRPVYCAPLSQEDFHNVDHAIMLKTFLEAEGATVIDTREMDKNRGTSPYAGHPWWQMDAPCHLYDQGYPVSVYAPISGVPPGTPGAEQVTEDRRTRPLTSNYSNADLFVSLHTNGLSGNCFGTSCPTGIEMYYDSTKDGGNASAAYTLANTCQDNCSAAVNIYFGSFPCRNGCNPRDSAFGEIHYPFAPACLLEFGFHDSCDMDALWLRDPLFTSAGMYGMYKGICQFFGVTPSYNGYSAEYVSDDIPTSVTQGDTTTVHITFINRGVAWSEGHQFRLGAVGDSDPFAGQRQTISGTVMPGQTYTFTFDMTFVGLGDQVTDWQMVRDGVGWFGDTVARTVTVLPSGDTEPPSIPQNLRVTDRTETTIDIAWDASTDNIGVYGYRVYRDGGLLGSTANTYYADSGLTPDTTYEYQVEAYDYVPNYSGLSSVLVASTLAPDTTPPSVPQNLRVQTATQDSITIAWDASTDDRGVAGYRVYRDGGLLGSTSNTYYADSGLSVNTTYNYQVDAYDAVPNYSALSDPFAAMTAAGLFSEGFDASLDNWALESIPANQPLEYSTAQNHGSLPGPGSAFASGSYAHFMYHWLDPSTQSLTTGGYRTGVYSGWLYDTMNANLRTGLRAYAYDSTGSNRATYWVGVYSTVMPGRYIGAVWDGVWAYYDLGPRSAGWHRLGIDVQPYTGSNDVQFLLDGAVKATATQPPASANAALKRIYIGYNYSVYSDHYYDDITFDSAPPAAPSNLTGTGVSENGIRWSFTDNANNEIGCRLYDGGTQIAQTEAVDTTYIDESGLAPNTIYSRTVKAYAGVLESDPSAPGTGCTLSVPPSPSTVTCSKPIGVWQSANPFQFTAVGGYGAGTLSYYRYVWDQSPAHTWTGSEWVWATVTTNRNATASANPWYFHVRGFNSYDQPNGTLDLGPYHFDDTAPSTPTVTDDGATTPSTTTLHATWSASDGESGIEGYEYAIGTSAGANDVVDWTEPVPATATEITRSDLTLDDGATYFISVRARNASQLVSSAGSSDGISVQVPEVGIAAAKALADGADVKITGRVVSAAFAGSFYIQEPDRTAAVRVLSGAAVTVGDIVDVVGRIQTAGGERYIAASSVTVQ